jgi:hypothetical protein
VDSFLSHHDINKAQGFEWYFCFRQGRFGGIFLKSSLNQNPKLYSVRPGGRMWLADSTGIVEHTMKFKVSNILSSSMLIMSHMINFKLHQGVIIM